MITTKQLYSLGYSKKPDNVDMPDGSTDFRHDDLYKVNMFNIFNFHILW